MEESRAARRCISTHFLVRFRLELGSVWPIMHPPYPYRFIPHTAPPGVPHPHPLSQRSTIHFVIADPFPFFHWRFSVSRTRLHLHHRHTPTPHKILDAPNSYSRPPPNGLGHDRPPLDAHPPASTRRHTRRYREWDICPAYGWEWYVFFFVLPLVSLLPPSIPFARRN